MAFLPNNQDQTQQQQGQAQGQIPTVPVIPSLQGTSGPTASQSGGTGVTNTATPGAAPSAPWQNVTAYLNANQQGSGNVADLLAGNLTSQYNTANQAIGNTAQNFGQEIQSARIPEDQNLVSQAKANPSQFVQDPNNVAAFQKMYNATYGGPQDFSHSQDYSNLAAQVQKAQNQAALVNQGTPGIMTTLMDAETQGGRNPTQGITALDSLLLQENPENFTKIANAAAPFAGLTNYLSSTQQGLDTQAQQAAQEAAATGSALQNQFVGPGGVLPTFQNKLNAALQADQSQAQKFNQNLADITSNLGGNTRLTPDQEFALDPTGGYGAAYNALQMAAMYPGVNPGLLASFYTAPAQAASPTLGNVASQDDFANAAALAQLTGQPNPLSGYTPGRAFVAPTGAGNFNAQGALSSIYNTLQGDTSYLPYMTNDQMANFPTIYNYIAGLTTGATPFNPVSQPTPPNPNIQLQGNTQSGSGGHAFF